MAGWVFFVFCFFFCGVCLVGLVCVWGGSVLLVVVIMCLFVFVCMSGCDLCFGFVCGWLCLGFLGWFWVCVVCFVRGCIWCGGAFLVCFGFLCWVSCSFSCYSFLFVACRVCASSGHCFVLFAAVGFFFVCFWVVLFCCAGWFWLLVVLVFGFFFFGFYL